MANSNWPFPDSACNCKNIPKWEGGGAKGQEERKGLSMKIKDYIIQYFSTENQTCSSSQSIGMHNWESFYTITEMYKLQ
jgi:hypothetical protein